MDLISALKGQANVILTWDLAAVSFVFLTAIFYGFSLSRKKLLIFLVSVYTAFVLFVVFPFFGQIEVWTQNTNTELILLGIFAVFVVLLYYVYSGSLVRLALPIPKRGKGPYWQTILLSISLAGLLLSIVFFIYDFSSMELSYYVRILFLNEIARFAWMLSPLFIVGLMKRVGN